MPDYNQSIFIVMHVLINVLLTWAAK